MGTYNNQSPGRAGKKPSGKKNFKKRLRKSLINILTFLNGLTLPVVIAACVVILVSAGLYIHFIYMPDGYYFWEKLPSCSCTGVAASLNMGTKKPVEVSICSYSDAFNGQYGCINYFGKVSIRSEADKESDLVAYVSFKDVIGTYGDSVNGYYFCKYEDKVSGKVFTGYISGDCISREEIQSSMVYLSVPKYMQTDSRWADIKIGGYETLESAGCTTTCLAMSYSCIRKEEILPSDMVKELYYDYDGNLAFPDEYIRYKTGNYLSDIYKQLNKGIPVLVGGFKPSGFPHWCIVYGYTGDGENFKNEDFLIYDPYTAERNNLGEFFQVFTTFNKIAYYKN